MAMVVPLKEHIGAWSFQQKYFLLHPESIVTAPQLRSSGCRKFVLFPIFSYLSFKSITMSTTLAQTIGHHFLAHLHHFDAQPQQAKPTSIWDIAKTYGVLQLFAQSIEEQVLDFSMEEAQFLHQKVLDKQLFLTQCLQQPEPLPTELSNRLESLQQQFNDLATDLKAIATVVVTDEVEESESFQTFLIQVADQAMASGIIEGQSLKNAL